MQMRAARTRPDTDYSVPQAQTHRVCTFVGRRGQRSVNAKHKVDSETIEGKKAQTLQRAIDFN